MGAVEDEVKRCFRCGRPLRRHGTLPSIVLGWRTGAQRL